MIMVPGFPPARKGQNRAMLHFFPGREKSLGSPRLFLYSFLLLMILDSSSMKLLISLNWQYTEAKRT